MPFLSHLYHISGSRFDCSGPGNRGYSEIASFQYWSFFIGVNSTMTDKLGSLTLNLKQLSSTVSKQQEEEVWESVFHRPFLSIAQERTTGEKVEV